MVNIWASHLRVMAGLQSIDGSPDASRPATMALRASSAAACGCHCPTNELVSVLEFLATGALSSSWSQVPTGDDQE